MSLYTLDAFLQFARSSKEQILLGEGEIVPQSYRQGKKPLQQEFVLQLDRVPDRQLLQRDAQAVREAARLGPGGAGSHLGPEACVAPSQGQHGAGEIVCQLFPHR